MKKAGLLLYALLVLAQGCYPVPQKQRAEDRIYRKTMRLLSKEGLVQISDGASSSGAPDYWVTHLSIGMEHPAAVKRDEARRLIVIAVETFVDRINASGSASRLFESLPVGEEQVRVRIYFDDRGDEYARSPYVHCVLCSKGTIEYLSRSGNSSNPYDLDDRFEETLDEAAQRLKSHA